MRGLSCDEGPSANGLAGGGWECRSDANAKSLAHIPVATLAQTSRKRGDG